VAPIVGAETPCRLFNAGNTPSRSSHNRVWSHPVDHEFAQNFFRPFFLTLLLTGCRPLLAQTPEWMWHDNQGAAPKPLKRLRLFHRP